jgi:hypothetical protein
MHINYGTERWRMLNELPKEHDQGIALQSECSVKYINTQEQILRFGKENPGNMESSPFHFVYKYYNRISDFEFVPSLESLQSHS